MKIIEFYGMPGCGKSTLSHQLSDALRLAGYNVKEPSYEIDHNYTKICRQMKKAWIIMLWIIKHPYGFFEIFKLLKKYLKQGIIDELPNVLTKAYYIEKYSDFDFVVFDEGIRQAVVSFQSPIYSNPNEVIKRLEEKIYTSNKCIDVYVRNSINTVLQWMETRDSNDSRVEKEKNIAKKKSMLKAVEDRCNLISNKDTIIVKLKPYSIEQIVQYIFDKSVKL